MIESVNNNSQKSKSTLLTTSLIIGLIVIIILLLISALILLGFIIQQKKNSICLTPECIHTGKFNFNFLNLFRVKKIIIFIFFFSVCNFKFNEFIC